MGHRRMKKRFFTLLTAVIFSLCMAVPGLSHGLWVNAHKNNIHPPGHVLTSVGFGHIPPLDDLLTSELGTLVMDTYMLVDPDQGVTDLPKPEPGAKTVDTASPLKITTGSLGACRIGFLPGSHSGTYLVAAKGKDTFFSVWMDQKGEIHRDILSMAQIRNPKKILTSMLYRANAKTYFTIDKWRAPGAMGWDLEIHPVTDLSNVKAGDEVRFKVTFMGKPVSSGMQGMFRMTGISRTSGMADKTFLMSYLQKGECSFIMPVPGQWLMQVRTKKQVSRTPALARFKGQCREVNYNASLTFHVGP